MYRTAAIAQLGERQTEDLKVPGSIPGRGSFYFLFENFDIKRTKRFCQKGDSNPRPQTWTRILHMEEFYS